MALIGFAILAFVVWLLLVAAVHVTAWAIHLILVVAVIAGIMALFNRARTA